MSLPRRRPSLWSPNTKKKPGNCSHPPRSGQTAATTVTSAIGRIATVARDMVRHCAWRGLSRSISGALLCIWARVGYGIPVPLVLEAGRDSLLRTGIGFPLLLSLPPPTPPMVPCFLTPFQSPRLMTTCSHGREFMALVRGPGCVK